MRTSLLMMIGLVVLMSACVEATRINTGGGKQSYLIDCSSGRGGLGTGTSTGMRGCIEKANQVCPSGYTIVQSSQTPTGGGNLFSVAPGIITAASQVSATLIVTCN